MTTGPAVSEGVCEMEFRLVFQGKLPAASQGSTRVEDKHRIRKVLHPQLREYWKANRYLRSHWMEEKNHKQTRYRYDVQADKYARCG
jgi:hypothetical protein